MEKNSKSELDDLKEIAINKIKIAYNRSIDLEATHSILWDVVENRKNFLLRVVLIISIILLTSIYIPILYGSILIIFILSTVSGILVIVIVGIIFLEIFLSVHSKIHKQILIDTFSLRQQCIDFIQYKIDNLDKLGFIDEIRLLETNDNNLKEKSDNFTHSLSKNVKSAIISKIDELEKVGFKKHVITQDQYYK